MIATMRKSVFLVVLALVLLAGLVGWTVKMEAAPPIPQHHSSIHTQFLTDDPNHFCPPPPYSCGG
ncbi:MAG TPA: hypothetical protein VEL69_01940 [Ktedonobacteraceae bacterium]|nr:hypothetical protein [Ktedonobacteraceae bacterium]